MGLATIVFVGQGVLAFRAFPGTHDKQKRLHAMLNGLACVLVLIGFVVVVAFHEKEGIDNFYSTHAWAGMAAIVALFLQGILGFAAFYWPTLSHSRRIAFSPLHQFFGLCTVGLLTVSLLLGIADKQRLLEKADLFAPSYTIANCLTILVVFAACGLYYLFSAARGPYTRAQET